MPSHHAEGAPVRLVPPTGSADTLPIPAPIAPFVGRTRELATLRELLLRPDVRVVTLTGTGGVGKTRLALQLAAQTADQLPDGATFVTLAPIADSELVIPAIARAVGAGAGEGQSWERRLMSALQGRRLLLVLDNVEHLPDLGPDIAPLLEASPRLTILATGRAPLGIYGEQVFPMLPLAVPEGAGEGKPSLGATDIASYDAVRLFVVRAQAVRPEFQVTDANAADVAAICQRLDGLPLAIELAAARVAHLAPAAILDRLEQRLALLTGGPRDHPERLRTMRDAIAWSYDLLTAPERAAFRRLGLFAGSFSLDEALTVAVVGDEEGVADPVFGPLQGLLDHSLIQRAGDDGGEPRFRLLETIRAFAHEQLLRNPVEAREAAARHAAAFVTLAERAEPALWGAEQGHWLDRLEVDLPNMRVARAWLQETRDVPSLLSLAVALGHFWALRGYFTEGRDWTERAIAAAADRPGLGHDRACALYYAAVLAYFQGDDTAADASASACLALCEAIDYRNPVSFATYVLALRAQRAGDLPRAAVLLDAALTAARNLDDPRITGYCLTHLARLAEIEGALAGAAQRAAEALAIHRANGDRFGIVVTLLTAAQVAIDQDDLATARDALGEALALLPSLRNQLMAAETLEIVSRLVIRRGDAERGVRLWAAAARLRTMLGVPVIAYWRVRHDAAIAEARLAMGERRFAAATAMGASLPTDEAIAAAGDAVGSDELAPLAASAAAAEDLTRREMDVLRLLVEGRSDKEIAAALFVSPRTATTHVASILGKLGATSRTAAAAIAVRRGLA